MKQGTLLRSGLTLAVAVLFVLAIPAPASVGAASTMPGLVAHALQNTNRARTLVYHDSSVLTTPVGKVTTHGQTVEDEVHGHKHVRESVAVTVSGSGGKARSVRYSVELIFVPGFTYYRTSLVHHWARQKGVTFADPYTGGWEGGRTTIVLPRDTHYRGSSTHAGQTHARFTFANGTARGTVDLWVAGTRTPYVVREEETLTAVSGPPGRERLEMAFGPFNQRVSIVEP